MKATIKTLRNRELFGEFLEANGSDVYKGHMWDDNEVVSIPAKMGFRHFTVEDFDDNDMLLPLKNNDFEGYEVDVEFKAYYGGFELQGEFYDHFEYGLYLDDLFRDVPDGEYALKISLQKID